MPLSPRLRWKLHRARERAEDRLRALLRPQPKPRVCFNCGRLVGAAEKACSHCGASQAALSVSAFRRVALAVIPAETPVTYALLFANLLFYAVAVLATQRAGGSNFLSASPQVLYYLGARESPSIWLAGEYWRLVMPIFLHWGLWHIGMNSIVLWQIGPQVEELFGSRRFLFMYLTTGVFGNVASAWWYTGGLSAGASGALFGLLGILISYVSQRQGFTREYRASLIRWVVFGLVLGIIWRFDNAAHIGGLVSGLALGRVVSDRRPATPGARLRVGLMVWGSAALIAWSVVMVLLHLPPAGGS